MIIRCFHAIFLLLINKENLCTIPWKPTDLMPHNHNLKSCPFVDASVFLLVQWTLSYQDHSLEKSLVVFIPTSLELT